MGKELSAPRKCHKFDTDYGSRWFGISNKSINHLLQSLLQATEDKGVSQTIKKKSNSQGYSSLGE